MGFNNRNQNKEQVGGLAKNPEKNNGITSKENIESEKELQDFLQKWFKGKHLHRRGYRQETSQTKEWDKKEKSLITKVEKEPSRNTGFGDIAIHHNGLDLSWTHKLANPLIIELKHPKNFRKATHQAVKYKSNSNSRFQKEDGRKICQTAIATTRSISTGEIATASAPTKHFSADFDCKRIYWNLKVGVVQSIQPDKAVISFGEADKVIIK